MIGHALRFLALWAECRMALAGREGREMTMLGNCLFVAPFEAVRLASLAAWLSGSGGRLGHAVFLATSLASIALLAFLLASSIYARRGYELFLRRRTSQKLGWNPTRGEIRKAIDESDGEFAEMMLGEFEAAKRSVKASCLREGRRDEKETEPGSRRIK